MRILLLLAAAAVCLSANAEPLNYDYVYYSATEIDNDSGASDSGDTLGAFLSFADTLHLFGSVDTAGAYSGGSTNSNYSYDTLTLRVGIGGHYLLTERLMIAPAIAVLRSRTEVSSPNWMYAREYEDTGYGAQVDLRYWFGNRWEVTGGARYSRVFDNSATELTAGPVFHINDWLALGALYHDGENRNSTELTLRWYF